MRMHLTIRKRLTVAYATIFLLLVATFGLSIYGLVRFQLEEAADDELAVRSDAAIQQLKESYKDNHPNGIQQSLKEHLEAVGKDEALQLRDANGALLFQSGLPKVVTLRPKHSFSTIYLSHKTYRFCRREIALPDRYILEVGIDRSEYQEALESIRTALYLGIPLGMLLSLVSGYWMSGRVLRPIQVVTNTVREIDSRKLALRLPLRGTEDELEDLSITLNDMLNRIQDAFHRVIQFTADASHELRTPLALARGNLEIMLSQPTLPGEAQSRSKAVLEEVDRMQILIGDLLELARSDEEGALAGELLDPADLARRAAEVGNHLASPKGVVFTAVGPKDIFPIFGNDRALSRVLVVLIDNAIRHTPQGNHVQLGVTSTAESLMIKVEDSGIGIAPEHLPLIFERFYRTDESRNRAVGGAGLGLAIAKAIVLAHGGTIAVESRPGVGSTFRITIPAARLASC